MIKTMIALVLLLPACALTEVPSVFEYDGPAEPLIVALNRTGHPITLPSEPLGNVCIRLSTPSDKAITWQREDILPDGTELFRDLSLNTSHETAAGARADDNRRVERVNQQVSGFLMNVVQAAIASQTGGLGGVGAPAIAPEGAATSDLLRRLSVLEAAATPPEPIVLDPPSEPQD